MYSCFIQTKRNRISDYNCTKRFFTYIVLRLDNLEKKPSVNCVIFVLDRNLQKKEKKINA